MGSSILVVRGCPDEEDRLVDELECLGFTVVVAEEVSQAEVHLRAAIDGVVVDCGRGRVAAGVMGFCQALPMALGRIPWVMVASPTVREALLEQPVAARILVAPATGIQIKSALVGEAPKRTIRARAHGLVSRRAAP